MCLNVIATQMCIRDSLKGPIPQQMAGSPNLARIFYSFLPLSEVFDGDP